jgi:hypothetical protein
MQSYKIFDTLCVCISAHYVCPDGWHLQNCGDWLTLVVFLWANHYSYDGNTVNYHDNNISGNNIIGITKALAATCYQEESFLVLC